LQLSHGNLNKHIFRLAGPSVLDNLSGALGIVLITALISRRLGTDALAASGASMVYLFLIQGVGIGLGVGATALVAQSIGAERPRLGSRYAGQAIMLAAVGSLCLIVVSYIWARPMLAFLGAGGSALDLALPYYTLCLCIAPVSLVLMIMAGVIRGYGDTFRPMVIMVLVMVFYFVFALVTVDPAEPAVQGMIHLGWGVICANLIGFVLGCWVLFGPNRTFRARVPDIFAFDPPRIREIISVSVPAFGEQLIARCGYFAFNKILFLLGTASFAAHRLAVGIEGFSFMPGFAFGVAATTLMGQAVGAGDIALARLATRRTALIGAAIMGTLGIVLFTVPGPLVTLIYRPEPHVADLATACVRISAFEQMPLALLFAYGGALRGAGDTLSPMLVRLTGTIAVRLPAAYLLGLVLRLDVPGIWAGLVFEWWLSCGIVYYLYRRGRWERTAAVHRAEGAAESPEISPAEEAGVSAAEAMEFFPAEAAD
jgi:putative MATE family efflux protein